jgi:hypothetical protein
VKLPRHFQTRLKFLWNRPGFVSGQNAETPVKLFTGIFPNRHAFVTSLLHPYDNYLETETSAKRKRHIDTRDCGRA